MSKNKTRKKKLIAQKNLKNKGEKKILIRGIKFSFRGLKLN
jgi:hypothetical protein